MSAEDFWDTLKGVNAAMLAVGDARHVPMSLNSDKHAKAIWFMTAQGTDLVKAIEKDQTDGPFSCLYEIAKANITGDRPDIGDHFGVRL